MAKIIPFCRPKPSERFKGRGLCDSGHHKWRIDKSSVFDVTEGRLLTTERCERCGATRTRAS